MKRATVLSIVKYVVGLALGGAIFYLALRGLNVQTLLEKLRGARYEFWALSLGITLLANLLRAYRWRQLIQATGHDANLGKAFAALMVGYLVNFGVPRLGEVARCTLLMRSSKVPFATAIGTVVSERLIDVLTLLVLMLALAATGASALLNLLGQADFASKIPHTNVFIGVALIGTGVLLGLWFFRKQLLVMPALQPVIKFLLQLWQSIISVRKVGNPLAFIVATLLIWLCYMLSMYYIFPALNFDSTQSLYFSFVLLIMSAIGMAIPLPGGLGSYHSAIVFAFVAYGFPTEEGQVFAVVSHAFQMALYIVGGFICYLYLLFANPEAPKAATAGAQG